MPLIKVTSSSKDSTKGVRIGFVRPRYVLRTECVQVAAVHLPRAAQKDSVYNRCDAEAIGCSSDGRQERRALSDWDGSKCGEEYLSLIKGELISVHNRLEDLVRELDRSKQSFDASCGNSSMVWRRSLPT